MLPSIVQTTKKNTTTTTKYLKDHDVGKRVDGEDANRDDRCRRFGDDVDGIINVVVLIFGWSGPAIST
jgi:hypothetical protein